MLDEIEALAAVAQVGTVSLAAARLRVTQSAVSKRIHSLQEKVGFRLLEPHGRRVRLTPRAVDFVERARPLVGELRALTRPVEGASLSSLSIALADSVASSWGPGIVARALAQTPTLRVDLHAHRSVLVIESVRLGRYHAGLCTSPPSTADLLVHPLLREPIVLVRASLGPRSDKRRPLITIEPTSATFRAIEPSLTRHHSDLFAGRLTGVESFGAVLQMVKAGFGDGLLPLGLAHESNLPRSAYKPLAHVDRHVVLLTRKTVDTLPTFQSLKSHLTAEAAALQESWSRDKHEE